MQTKGRRCGPVPIPLADRFWAKVVIAGDDDCWIWHGQVNERGYGRIRVGRMRFAHHVSYELSIGPIPDGLWVLHKCDNPPCCNPSHFFLGTNADNVADRDAKGRGVNPPRRFGEANNNSKLTAADVLSIRERLCGGESQSAIARSLGVGHSTVNLIAGGQTWKHLIPASEAESSDSTTLGPTV